jgi:hypothetical protein
MENAKQQLVDRIKSASNVLVTVGRNPSVDALSALLGLTLVLNKQGKHAAAVFSGQVPSTMEFLQPEQTIEKNTDSLRDFIIALDKNKADKLRYKVEDNVVRIFITPYKTSISQEDFEFSEGDFNIDVVIALGVRQQEDLDEAITAHGRILHDATVATINIVPDSGLGSINWYEPQSSSLSELVTDLAQMLAPNLLDEQIATALLTGIVAETERFSNDKTSSVTMSMSAALMKAGANQQLVASKLEAQLDINKSDIADQSNTDNNAQPPADSTSANDGSIQIDHTAPPSDTSTTPDAGQSDSAELKDNATEENSTPAPDNAPESELPPPPASPLANNLSAGPKLMTEPPTLGGMLTANSSQSDTDPVVDPLSLTNKDKADQPPERNELTNDVKAPDLAPLTLADVPSSQPASLPPPIQAPEPPLNLTAPPPSWTPPPIPTPLSVAPPSSPAPSPSPAPAPNPSPVQDDSKKSEAETLADIEHAVASPHVKDETIDAARVEVKQAYNDPSVGPDESLGPIDALNAQQLGNELHPDDANAASPQPTDTTAPPPVPPPIPFQFGNPPSA